MSLRGEPWKRVGSKWIRMLFSFGSEKVNMMFLRKRIGTRYFGGLLEEGCRKGQNNEGRAYFALEISFNDWD